VNLIFNRDNFHDSEVNAAESRCQFHQHFASSFFVQNCSCLPKTAKNCVASTANWPKLPKNELQKNILYMSRHYIDIYSFLYLSCISVVRSHLSYEGHSEISVWQTVRPSCTCTEALGTSMVRPGSTSNCACYCYDGNETGAETHPTNHHR